MEGLFLSFFSCIARKCRKNVILCFYSEKILLSDEIMKAIQYRNPFFEGPTFCIRFCIIFSVSTELIGLYYFIYISHIQTYIEPTPN